MNESKKIYDALAFLIDQQRRSSAFFLESTGKEYHMLSDGDIVIMLSYEREDNMYEISTINFIGAWIDLDLQALMAMSGSTQYEIMWRHLNYFNITPQKIYDLYSNDSFEYCLVYETDETNFDEND
jgi:hypothetical protein